MLPSVLQRRATDHLPVLAEEVRAPARRASRRDRRRRHVRSRRPRALLAADLNGRGRYIAIDRDPSVRPYFESFKRRFGSLQPRLLRGDFSLVLEQLADNGVEADAILLDLGVSSMQLDHPERGFSYATDAPLDMRMDPSAEPTRRRPRQRGARARARPTSSSATARSATRGRSRARSSRRRPLDDDVRARRRRQVGDPRARALRRRPSREARLPGAAHRGQRRARRAGARAARGARACCVRADGSR